MILKQLGIAQSHLADFIQSIGGAQFELFGGQSQQRGQRARRRVATARMQDAGHVQFSSVDRIGVIAGRTGQSFQFEFDFAVRGVGQHVGADSLGRLDLRPHAWASIAARAPAGPAPNNTTNPAANK